MKASELYNTIRKRCFSTIDNPLAAHLKQTIKSTGPLSCSHFMRNCLMHPVYGYYNSKTAIGSRGDFITSPEISQTFGEMCAIWYSQIFPVTGKFQFVELGPGKGTLLNDILYTWKSLGIAQDSLDQIHLVERSHLMRNAQAHVLGVIKKMDNGSEWGRSEKYNVDVFWHDELKNIPQDHYTLFMAHEFFDALPCFKFQKTDKGWREVLVDVDESLEFVLASNPTDSSVLLTQGSRYKNLKVGDRVEVSYESWRLAKELNNIVSSTNGGGLIIDYGKNTFSSDSLRAIGDHTFKGLFDNIGQVDLSVDVDFSLLSEAFTDLISLGPISQRDFLVQMGVLKRLELLISANPEKRQEISSSVERLIGTDDKSMGTAYKVMGLTSKEKYILPFH